MKRRPCTATLTVAPRRAWRLADEGCLLATGRAANRSKPTTRRLWVAKRAHWCSSVPRRVLDLVPPGLRRPGREGHGRRKHRREPHRLPNGHRSRCGSHHRPASEFPPTPRRRTGSEKRWPIDLRGDPAEFGLNESTSLNCEESNERTNLLVLVALLLHRTQREPPHRHDRRERAQRAQRRLDGGLGFGFVGHWTIVTNKAPGAKSPRRFGATSVAA